MRVSEREGGRERDDFNTQKPKIGDQLRIQIAEEIKLQGRI